MADYPYTEKLVLSAVLWNVDPLLPQYVNMVNNINGIFTLQRSLMVAPVEKS